MARLYTRLGFSELSLLGFRAAIEQGYFSVDNSKQIPGWIRFDRTPPSQMP